MTTNKKQWKKLASKVVHTNPWYSVVQDDVILPNGQNGKYFIVKTGGGSAYVVPIKGDKIIFVRQYRYVFDDWFLELPGGGMLPNELAETVAKKELREETGYVAETIEKIGSFIPMSGVIDEISHVFLAKNVKFDGQDLEASEAGTHVVEVPIERAYEMIESGEIIDGQTISALTLTRNKIL